MIQHLKEDHNCEVIQEVKKAIVKSWERPRFKGSPPQFPYTLVYFDDQTFGIHAACTGGFFYTWVECVSRKDVMHYFCKIVARSQDKNTQYTFRCVYYIQRSTATY